MKVLQESNLYLYKHPTFQLQVQTTSHKFLASLTYDLGNVFQNFDMFSSSEEELEEPLRHRVMGKISLTSPIVINVTTRASLVVETKGLVFLWLAHLNNKSNVCKQISSLFGSQESLRKDGRFTLKIHLNFGRNLVSLTKHSSIYLQQLANSLNK